MAERDRLDHPLSCRGLPRFERVKLEEVGVSIGQVTTLPSASSAHVTPSSAAGSTTAARASSSCNVRWFVAEPLGVGRRFGKVRRQLGQPCTGTREGKPVTQILDHMYKCTQTGKSDRVQLVCDKRDTEAIVAGSFSERREHPSEVILSRHRAASTDVAATTEDLQTTHG